MRVPSSTPTGIFTESVRSFCTKPRPPQERHVIGVLVIGQPDHPRKTVRASAVVGDIELLDPQYAPPAPRQMVHGRTPHAAHTQHDRIVLFHGLIVTLR